MARSTYPRNVQRGYSLGTLFLLTAACAALLAIVTPLLRGRVGNDIGVEQFAGSMISGGAALGGVGLLVGLFHFRRFRGVLLGLLAGIGLGACCGPLAFVPAEQFSQVLLLGATGAAVILGLAAAIRAAGGGWNKRGLVVIWHRQPPVRPRPRPHPLDPDPDEAE